MSRGSMAGIGAGATLQSPTACLTYIRASAHFCFRQFAKKQHDCFFAQQHSKNIRLFIKSSSHVKISEILQINRKGKDEPRWSWCQVIIKRSPHRYLCSVHNLCKKTPLKIGSISDKASCEAWGVGTPWIRAQRARVACPRHSPRKETHPPPNRKIEPPHRNHRDHNPL